LPLILGMLEPIPFAQPEVTPPKLPGTVVVRPEPEDLIGSAASDLLIHAFNCVRSFGDFHLALSGGSTPLPLYERLMVDPNYRDFPWTRTHLWIVDERRVGFDSDKSNFKAIDEILGEHSGIPREQVHPIMALRDDADLDYERTLRQQLFFREKGQDRLDYVLLGMGADGHTASLFPQSPALEDLTHDVADAGIAPPRLVRINAGPTVVPPERVTMTYSLLNAARFIGVLVTGSGKRETIAKLVGPAGADDAARLAAARTLPILGIRPKAGELRWYLDAAACPKV
jgi:6-phosphogluconolactonase